MGLAPRQRPCGPTRLRHPRARGRPARIGPERQGRQVPADGRRPTCGDRKRVENWLGRGAGAHRVRMGIGAGGNEDLWAVRGMGRWVVERSWAAEVVLGRKRDLRLCYSILLYYFYFLYHVYRLHYTYNFFG